MLPSVCGGALEGPCAHSSSATDPLSTSGELPEPRLSFLGCKMGAVMDSGCSCDRAAVRPHTHSRAWRLHAQAWQTFQAGDGPGLWGPWPRTNGLASLSLGFLDCPTSLRP